MNGHHLIMGELTDFITGETLKKTHDELLRQNLAQILVHDKGYGKEEILPRFELVAAADDKRAKIWVDFVITLGQITGMIVQYGPGSLTTRHRPALAISRLVADCQVPVAVVTNGKEADILDGTSGEVLRKGLENIPTKPELSVIIDNSPLDAIPENRAEMESRILYAYEVDGSCPCDDTICRL